MVFVVCFQEGLDLFRKEGEQLFGRLGNHELARNGDFALGNREGGVAVQLDGTDTEVGAAQVDSHVEPLFVLETRSSTQMRASYLLGAIGYGSHVSGDLAHFGALLLQALVCASVSDQSQQQRGARMHTHFPYEFLDSFVESIVAEVKLGSDLLGLVGESHAALVVSVEGSDELDVLFGLGADGGILEEDGGLEGYGR
jgi:hypothetical protein